MAYNKVKFLRGTSNEYAVAEKDSDTIYFTTDDGKLYIGDKEIPGDGNITIDETLSDTSTNPVQNKIIKQAIDNKANKSLYGDTTINVGRKAGTDVGEYSTAEGYDTIASGSSSHAEGYDTIASGSSSHAEGYNTTASGNHSHAEGYRTTASGYFSHAEGRFTTASGDHSHAEGDSYNEAIDAIPNLSSSTSNRDILAAWRNKPFNLAKGNGSHSEGYNTLAINSNSHAEGFMTIASGNYSHAEGSYTVASGDNSHAEGANTTASGDYSHTEGQGTTASRNYSHAEGYSTVASGTFSYAGGHATKALHDSEVAYGKYNQSNDDTLFSIGDGTADDARHNAFEITTTGGKLHDNDIATTNNIPNPNLLINPDFRINQYGFSSKTFGTTVTYFIDRWTGERCVVTKNSSGGIDYSWNGTDGTYGKIAQRFENSQYLFGKNVTISADIDGVRKKLSFTLPSEINKMTYLIYFTDSSIGAYMGINSQSQVYVVLTSKSTTAASINNVKLEIGEVATPFIPPNITEEQIKCQRYYLGLNRYVRYPASRRSTGDIDFIIPVNAMFRSTPTIIGNPVVYDANNTTAQSGFTFSIVSYGINAMAIRATKSAHGLTSAYLEVIDDVSLDAEIY